MSWQRQGSVLAWPRDWQRPNKTEEWAYERCLAAAQASPFVQVLCFPWATLIDLQRKGRHDKAKPLLEALHWAPPRMTLKRATVMQHIWAKDMLPQLQALGITDVYWSHATQAEIQWPGGIRIHPFPLYPVCCGPDADPALVARTISGKRPYLYSFVGAYEPGLYLSEARHWIFDLPARPDVRVERRAEWHYQGPVYRQQIEGQVESAQDLAARQAREAEYRQTLAESIFSLCPSGSGPNSIRLWESLGMGCIPVVLSDSLKLPDPGFPWTDACVFIPEERCAVQSIPGILQALANDHEQLARMQENAARAFFNFFGCGLEAMAKLHVIPAHYAAGLARP